MNKPIRELSHAENCNIEQMPWYKLHNSTSIAKLPAKNSACYEISVTSPHEAHKVKHIVYVGATKDIQARMDEHSSAN